MNTRKLFKKLQDATSYGERFSLQWDLKRVQYGILPIYSINCFDDAVCGDEVEFLEAVFLGSFRSASFSHYRIIRGVIIKDSYGERKQQHTFTIKIKSCSDKEYKKGDSKCIKGRNLYKICLHRKRWDDEKLREVARKEKHERGDVARHARSVRRMEEGYW